MVIASIVALFAIGIIIKAYTQPETTISSIAKKWIQRIWVDVTTDTVTTSPPDEKDSNPPASHNDIMSSALFVGIDCEMVGVGRGGYESILARCSIVTMPMISHKKDDDDNNNDREQQEQVHLLYDTYVKPTKRVTDYRTQWSGITASHLKGNNVKTLEECRMEVAEILSSSADGRVVVVVGHALENDFEVLKLKHPSSLIRDTATYPPFMTEGRRRMYPRKLSVLTQEYLGIGIQNSSVNNISIIKPHQTTTITKDEKKSTKNDFITGHCSIEDAAATLLLYKKVSYEWEAMLNFPLRKYSHGYDDDQKPKLSIPESNILSSIMPVNQNHYTTLYLDGCNLPMGLRRRKRNIVTDTTTNSLCQYQLLSKTKTHGNAQVDSQIDWVPLFRSLLLSSSSSISNNTMNSNGIPPIKKIVIMMDGASFKTMPKDERPRPSQKLFGNDDDNIELYLEVTDEKIEVDDVLVTKCKEDYAKGNGRVSSGNIISVEKVVDIFSQGFTTSEAAIRNKNMAKGCKQHQKKRGKRIQPKKEIQSQNYNHTSKTRQNEHEMMVDSYVIVRRKGGGTKTNKQLFNKLHLRRPHEGAHCLSPSFVLTSFSSDRLSKNSLQTARELKRANVHQIVEYEIQKCKNIRSVVITEDVLLADRVVGCGGLVLTYKQLQQLF